MIEIKKNLSKNTVFLLCTYYTHFYHTIPAITACVVRPCLLFFIVIYNSCDVLCSAS